MNRNVLIMGSGPAGIQAALDLADVNIPVTLVESSPTLNPQDNGHGLDTAMQAAPKYQRAYAHPNIKIITDSYISQVWRDKGEYSVTLKKQPRYVDISRCTSCGRCEEVCPVNLVDAADGNGSSRKAIHFSGLGLKAAPSSVEITKRGMPPCTAACPAGVNAHGYVALVSKGDFKSALELITQTVPFPSVLGRVCNRPCEERCSRGLVDTPVSICALKRFVSDAHGEQSALSHLVKPQVKTPIGEPVAIIGSGPAGLAAARDLTLMGYKITVFEALSQPGGMITVGMPRFRLPHEIREKDIADIINLGIELKTSTPIGPDLTIEDLKTQGFKAILIATGAHRNQRLQIAGENLSGVMDSIHLLKSLNLKQPVNVGSKVVVIGGGYTAIDSARTAVRLNCKSVTILYRRSLEEMPANQEEVTEAVEEGVAIEYLTAPVRIIGRQGKVAAIVCVRMRLGEPDKSGRRRPIPIKNSEFMVEVDTVIVAAGQRPELSFLEGDTTLTQGRRHILVDHRTMATLIPGVFAAGDVVREDANTMVNAIAMGRRVAVSIDRYFKGQKLPVKETRKKAFAEVDIAQTYIPEVEHKEMPCLPHVERLGNFEEVELGYDTETAMKEAQRCLNCGGCSDCMECEQVCELDAVNHSMAGERSILKFGAVISAEKIGTLKSGARFKKIKYDDITGASAAASTVMVDVSGVIDRAGADFWESATIQPGPDVDIAGESRTGVLLCHCGGNISDVIDTTTVARKLNKSADAAYCGHVDYACADDGAKKMKEAILRHNLNRVVLAACACCSLDQICFSCSDRRIKCKSSLQNDNQLAHVAFEFVNIREHCAWVHSGDRSGATEKALAIVRAGMSAISGKPSESFGKRPRINSPETTAIVVGAGIAGMKAATDLAAQGVSVVVIHPKARSAELGLAVWQKMEENLLLHGVRFLYQVKINGFKNVNEKFVFDLGQGKKQFAVPGGAVVFDMGSWEESPLPEHFGRGIIKPANRRLAGGIFAEAAESRIPGVFKCNSGLNDSDDINNSGAAAAGKAMVWLNRNWRGLFVAPAVVDAVRCRACNTCLDTCEYNAVEMLSNECGDVAARIYTELCRGCGACVAKCPSGAISQDSYSDDTLMCSVGALLSSR
ncbi:FAD-dependent oxidoreductase [Chloroflexota bacterium]